MTIYISLLVAIIGALMYGFCANPKLQEIGKYFIFAGVLAFLLTYHSTVSWLR
jgi:hypothetical protein